MAGDRQQVRVAVAAFFGGQLITADQGIAYQGGPLTAAGLGTVYPYSVKGIPDQYYFAGQAAGTGWGTVMGLAAARDTTREAVGGPTSGWRKRVYTVTCDLLVLAELRHIETAGAGLDDLIDAMHALIYADRTLGTTSASYPTGRLITQAGEGTYGIKDATEPFEPVVNRRGDADERGRYWGRGALSFQALTMVQA